MYRGLRLPSQSTAHQAVVIGEPAPAKFELVKFGENQVECRYDERAEQPNLENRVEGYTGLTNMEIKEIGDEWMEAHPTYNVRTSNCQHFAKYLAKRIIDPRLVGRQYRFKPNYIDLLYNAVVVEGAQPGWIMPKAETILVNVKQTDEENTWTGQVEGSEECGKFHAFAVEPMH